MTITSKSEQFRDFIYFILYILQIMKSRTSLTTHFYCKAVSMDDEASITSRFTCRPKTEGLIGSRLREYCTGKLHYQKLSRGTEVNAYI